MLQRIALLGFGVVGQGLAEILLNKGDSLEQDLGFRVKVVAICDFLKGSIYHPEGLSLKRALEAVKKPKQLDAYPDEPGLIRGWDSWQTILESNADTIVEMTYTDVNTGQPAIDHCKAAFQSGKHVVMTNKGPVALAYQELTELAAKKGVRWGYEGTVMSGTPALRMPLTSLAGNDITEISGILNGTTNFMLGKMEQGASYGEALKEAQELGYAEADPSSDVEGHDARYKAVILANVVMKVPMTPEDVRCKGITGLTEEEMDWAKRQGKRWKLLATVKREGETVKAEVSPQAIPMNDPLAGVMGATNAITYHCDLAGPITLVGAGAGRTETGYSLLIDLINIHRRQI